MDVALIENFSLTKISKKSFLALLRNFFGQIKNNFFLNLKIPSKKKKFGQNFRLNYTDPRKKSSSVSQR